MLSLNEYYNLHSNEFVYLDAMLDILKTGDKRPDRTGVGTTSKFGVSMKFDVEKNFPLLSHKKIFTKSVFHELLWFLRGDTNIRYLTANNVHIWDEWADGNGEVGRVYGYQWRKWETDKGRHIDQIQNVINSLRSDPYSRRHIVTAWNPSDINECGLPPCHDFFQFYVREDKYLDCQMYQRSGDMFIGIPFDIASYATLMHLIGHLTNYKPGNFTLVLGDAHIYNNHVDQVEKYRKRCHSGEHEGTLPQLHINKDDITNIDDFKYDDITVLGYTPLGHIKAPIAV